MSTDYQFKGYAAFDETSVKGNFKEHVYEPKPWMEDDVDIEIQYCGVVSSSSLCLSNSI